VVAWKLLGFVIVLCFIWLIQSSQETNSGGLHQHETDQSTVEEILNRNSESQMMNYFLEAQLQQTMEENDECV
jgi:nitrogen fixation-related uncharacterized protein